MQRLHFNFLLLIYSPFLDFCLEGLFYLFFDRSVRGMKRNLGSFSPGKGVRSLKLAEEEEKQVWGRGERSTQRGTPANTPKLLRGIIPYK